MSDAFHCSGRAFASSSRNRISSSCDALYVQRFPFIDVTAISPAEPIEYDPAPRPASPPLEVTPILHGSFGAVLDAAHDSINIIVAITESFMTFSAL